MFSLSCEDTKYFDVVPSLDSKYFQVSYEERQSVVTWLQIQFLEARYVLKVTYFMWASVHSGPTMSHVQFP